MKKKKAVKKAAKKSKKKSERRRVRDRRKKGALDLIFHRMVARNIFPERRKGDRRV